MLFTVGGNDHPYLLSKRSVTPKRSSVPTRHNPPRQRLGASEFACSRHFPRGRGLKRWRPFAPGVFHGARWLRADPGCRMCQDGLLWPSPLPRRCRSTHQGTAGLLPPFRPRRTCCRELCRGLSKSPLPIPQCVCTWDWNCVILWQLRSLFLTVLLRCDVSENRDFRTVVSEGDY